eukprot:SAG22_NODE_2848_length_2160_cov_6.810771_3_plen_45_part_00
MSLRHLVGSAMVGESCNVTAVEICLSHMPLNSTLQSVIEFANGG